MLFFYAQDRIRSHLDGHEPDEDFFLAGSNLYEHAIIMQQAEKDESDTDDAEEVDDDNLQF